MMRSFRRSLIVVGALAALTLAGCSGGDSAEKTFNDADVAFATEMIPHHQQAVEMSALAESRAKDRKVLDLAARIKGAQDPEIQQMSGMLEAWGEDVPSADGGHGDHGSMPGMMSEDEMTGLGSASGAAFDRMYLEMMIRHHQGAIEMARTETADGVDPEARKLAETIARVQQSEIEEMTALLKA